MQKNQLYLKISFSRKGRVLNMYSGNTDHFKKKYMSSWEFSVKKESFVKVMIEELCGRQCLFEGLGTHSNRFIPGSAEQNGYMKGAPDIKIQGTNISIEVTGPNKLGMDIADDLWILPSKICNALMAVDRDSWLCHLLPFDFSGTNFFVRFIHLSGKPFLDSLENNEFVQFGRMINGSVECFFAIPANHDCILSKEVFKKYLNEKTSPGFDRNI